MTCAWACSIAGGRRVFTDPLLLRCSATPSAPGRALHAPCPLPLATLQQLSRRNLNPHLYIYLAVLNFPNALPVCKPCRCQTHVTAVCFAFTGPSCSWSRKHPDIASMRARAGNSALAVQGLRGQIAQHVIFLRLRGSFVLEVESLLLQPPCTSM